MPYIKPQKPREAGAARHKPWRITFATGLNKPSTQFIFHAKNPDLEEKIGKILKEKLKDPDSESDEDEESDNKREMEEGAKKGFVEEDDPEWPVDAEVRWGIWPSDFSEKHPIKNVVKNRVEIDWEGELDNDWVQERRLTAWSGRVLHITPAPLPYLLLNAIRGDILCLLNTEICGAKLGYSVALKLIIPFLIECQIFSVDYTLLDPCFNDIFNIANQCGFEYFLY